MLDVSQDFDTPMESLEISKVIKNQNFAKS